MAGIVAETPLVREPPQHRAHAGERGLRTTLRLMNLFGPRQPPIMSTK
jgi:hypothetical protein